MFRCLDANRSSDDPCTENPNPRASTTQAPELDLALNHLNKYVAGDPTTKGSTLTGSREHARKIYEGLAEDVRHLPFCAFLERFS